MSIRDVEVFEEVAIIEGRHMSAVGLQFAITDPLNPANLSAKMGISLDTLFRAAHANVNDWVPNSTESQRLTCLQPVANLWNDLAATFGGEENAKLFLHLRRPELMGRNAPVLPRTGRTRSRSKPG